MLKIIHKWYRKDFSKILRKASEHMGLAYGLELKEVKPNSYFYTLSHNQDDTNEENLSRGWRFPMKVILMLLLGVIFLNGNCTSEEIWEFLNMMVAYDGESHLIWGESRKLITQDLVQEKYPVYQQELSSGPPCREFLRGLRAQAESSKMQILELLAELHDSDPTAFPCYYEEALKDEEESAQGRAQAAATAGNTSRASGQCTATSSTTLTLTEFKVESSLFGWKGLLSSCPICKISCWLIVVFFLIFEVLFF